MKSPPVWTRKFAAVLAVLLFTATAASALKRSWLDFDLILHWAPRRIVPPGHETQVWAFRQIVPPGSTVLFLMEQDEAWQIGLWQRSLYPDYLLLSEKSLAQMSSAAVQKLRSTKAFEYVLSQGARPLRAGLIEIRVLNPYPGSIPIILGRLPPP